MAAPHGVTAIFFKTSAISARADGTGRTTTGFVVGFGTGRTTIGLAGIGRGAGFGAGFGAGAGFGVGFGAGFSTGVVSKSGDL